ncbi:MAG: proprotein convertase P-domain-containing protein, partial [Bacteroidetes bacterium]|nr:proprotein convertase P-domain-containing protein [Bacteroidota bacterium]
MKKITLTLLAFLVTFGMWQVNAQKTVVVQDGNRTVQSTVNSTPIPYVDQKTEVGQVTFPLRGNNSTRLVPCAGVLPNYTNSDSGGGGVTSQDFEPANEAFTNQAADDFVVPGTGTSIICQVDVVGSYSSGGLPADPGSTVEMFIYDDAAGLPGALLFSESFPGPALDPGATGNFSLSPTMGATDLTGGSTYWISIQVQMNFGLAGQWFWNASLDGNGNAYAWQNPNNGFGTGCVVYADGTTCLGFGGPDRAMNISFNQAVTSECGNAPELIPTVGSSGPMIPSIATIATVGTVGVDYMILSVDLNLNHTFDGDLDISLTSPGGIVLNLSDDNGGAGNDYIDTIFTDGAPNITTGVAPFTGMFEPEGGTLNGTFAGEPVNGNWTLDIFDDAGGDVGVLNSYCINFILIPPIIVCPTDVNANTDPGVCGATINFADAIAIDPGGGTVTVVQTGGLPSGSVFPVGVSVIEFTATTDATGAMSTCTFNITVTDNEDPVVVCQDITVQLDASGLVTVPVGDVVASSSDNCGIVSIEFGLPLISECGPTPLLIPETGTSGAMLPSPANVTDTGLVGTDYSIASVELDLNHTFDGDLDITLTSPMGTVLVLADQLGGSGDDYTGTVFVDGSPNITTGSAPFTGMFEPQGGTLNGTFAGESITGDWTLNIFDNFGGDSGVLNNYCINFLPLIGGPDITLGCADVGVNQVTVTVTDPSGNTATCMANITVEDNIAPVIVCIGEQVVGPNTVSDSPGTPILDNTTVSTTINVPDSFTITDLNIDMNITHTWVGD